MTRVLLIEDEAQHTALVKLRLAANDMQVVTASTGTGGISAAAEGHPDLILLDLLLPDMQPAEIIRKLRAIPSSARTPIVALTALDPREISRRCPEEEFSAIITKPYDSKDLIKRVKALTKK